MALKGRKFKSQSTVLKVCKTLIQVACYHSKIRSLLNHDHNKFPFAVCYIDQSIQFWSGFIPLIGGGWIYPTLFTANDLSNSHSPSCSIHDILLLQTNTLALLHLHVPCLLWSSSCPLAFTSNSQRFSQNMPIPSSLLNTCTYHLTPFVFAIWTTVLHHTLLSPLLSRSFSNFPETRCLTPCML